MQQQSSPATTSMGVMTGRVIWFDDGKGYGFIHPDDGFNWCGEDIFVHYTAIQSSDKRRRLLPQQLVEFETVQDSKGRPMAHNVRVVTP